MAFVNNSIVSHTTSTKSAPFVWITTEVNNPPFSVAFNKKKYFSAFPVSLHIFKCALLLLCDAKCYSQKYYWRKKQLLFRLQCNLFAWTFSVATGSRMVNFKLIKLYSVFFFRSHFIFAHLCVFSKYSWTGYVATRPWRNPLKRWDFFVVKNALICDGHVLI